MTPPEVGQIYKGRYHHKVIRILKVNQGIDNIASTCWVELVVASGKGKQWPVQWKTLDRSYNLLDEWEATADHLLTLPGGGAKLNIP